MLEFKPYFTGDVRPYASVTWSTRDVEISNKEGELLYECKDAEFPESWSDNACQIVAAKYFRESRTGDKKETSAWDMVQRVTKAIAEAGVELKYFDEENGKVFESELQYLLVNQIASFNSPVWFNLGVEGVDEPQCSACFINSVEDSMDSILGLAATEGLIFKEGSGSGTNFSTLRGSKERIKGGGRASGPVSFMRGYDGFASVILSGGRARRAARMCILDADHPDIFEFVNCKSKEEDIAEKLIAAGMTADFTDKDSAYSVVKHQSGNNSVRVTDEFMGKARDNFLYNRNGHWVLHDRIGGGTTDASVDELFSAIANAAHKCGDPGLQFHDTVNKMNTCPNNGPITSSNPCSEFMWLDDSACNLASINLMKFRETGIKFNATKFAKVVELLIVAQDILVSIAGYPTKKIEKNSQEYRPLGLGFANLGGLLMSWGLPYDSEPGCHIGGVIASLMSAEAYLTSSKLATEMGAFKHHEANADEMLDVIYRHKRASESLPKGLLDNVLTAANKRWKAAAKAGVFRNAQVTLLAPTGTIGFMMDCATTGVEPSVGMVSYKTCVGGHVLKMVNPVVPQALDVLGYSEDMRDLLIEHLAEKGHFEEATGLKEEHLDVFDCAISDGKRTIGIDGHLNMLASIQPFLSGAISKTFNMPNSSTPKQIKETYIRAWELGLKCVTIYRAESKMSEPIRVREVQEQANQQVVPQRKKRPQDIKSDGHKFTVAGHTGYIHAGLHPDTGELIEVFIRMAGHGSLASGLLDGYGVLFSKALQYNIPLDQLVDGLEGTNFPPSGMTANQDIPFSKSILDYIGKWLNRKYILKVEGDDVPPLKIPDEVVFDLSTDTCPDCGHNLKQTGGCLQCNNCSYNSGVCS